MTERNKIQFVIEINEHGKAIVKDMGDDFEKLDKKAQKTDRTFRSVKAAWVSMAAAFAAFGVARMVGEMGDLIAAAEEQRKAVAGMETAMRSMGRYSPELSNELQDVAESLQMVSNFGDEATLQGVKFLLTYREISDDLLPRSMKTMQDLAALMGGDVVQAANMLGKASMGMTGELRRVGITVDNATWKSQGYLGVLKQIEAQVGGQAAAMRDPWTQLSNVIGDAKEVLGGFVGIAFEDYANDMIRLLPELSKSWREVAESANEARKVLIQFEMEQLERQLAGKGMVVDLPGTMAPDFTIMGMTAEEEAAIRAKLKRYQEILNEFNKSKDTLGGGGIGGAGDQLPTDLAKIVEQEAMKFEAAKAQKTQLEIFMESERITALQDMELSHRQWEMDQLTASSEYKMAAMQSEHEWACESIRIRNEEMVAAELDYQNRMVAIDQQAAQYRQQIAIGLGTALLSAAGASAKQIFAVTQGFQIGLAIMSAHAAYAKALAEVPFPANFAVAKAALVAGYLQAAAIAATTIGQLTVGSGGGGGTAVNAPGSTGYQPSAVGNVESLGREADRQREYAQKWEIHIHNLVGEEEWVENNMVPILRKVAKRDTEITVSFD